MFHHLECRWRDFQREPLLPNRRRNWEILAILRGRAAAYGPDLTTPEPRSMTVTVAGPESHHGWCGSGSAACELVVFHFASLPQPLAGLVGDSGCRSCPIERSQATQLRAWQREAQQAVARPDACSHLVHDRIRLDLALMCSRLLLASAPEAGSPMRRTLRFALHWFEQHMHRGVGVADMAEACGISTTHLRRLFVSGTGISPLQAMRSARLERAKRLLLASEADLQHIAAAVGLSSASSLVREFKQAEGHSPGRWRQAARSRTERHPV